MTNLYMDKIISGLKTEVIWPDNGELDTNSIIPVEIGSVLQQTTKPIVSIMDLGKMLLQSAKLGETCKVHELMCRGAPFTTDWLGTTPLHLAAVNNHYKTCEVLLRAGISKDARTKVDRTPLHLAVYEGHEQIVELLLANKCEVDARDMLKMTALHWAVEKRHRSIVSMLLKHGADPCATSKFFITPLSIAIETNQQDILQELLSWNIKPSETEMACDTILLEDFIEDSIDPSSANSKSSALSTSGTTTAAQSTTQPRANKNNNTKNEILTKSVSDNESIQILREHAISMLDDMENNTLFSSALQNGRKLVLSDAGKLLLNDLKLKKEKQTITRNDDDNNNDDDDDDDGDGHTMTQATPISINSTTTTATVPMVANGTSALITSSSIKSISENNNQKGCRQGILMPMKQIPLKANKVFKILSADEFKQMCNGNGNLANSLKRISANGGGAFNNINNNNNYINNIGNVRYQTLTNANNHSSIISKAKRFIINKNTCSDSIKSQAPITTVKTLENTSSSNCVKAIHIQSKKSQSSICSTSNNCLSASSSAKLDIISKVAPITTSSIKTIDCNSSSININNNNNSTNSSCSNTNQTIPSLINETQLNYRRINESTQTVDPVCSLLHHDNKQLIIESKQLAVCQHQQSPQSTPSPILLSEIERQILELRKETDELRRQLELSQKQNDDYKIRLEKLEREKNFSTPLDGQNKQGDNNNATLETSSDL